MDNARPRNRTTSDSRQRSAEAPIATGNATTHILAGWSGELTTFLALLVAIAAGVGLFFRVPTQLTLAPMAGFVAALGCRRWWSASLVGALGVFMGTATASLVSNPGWREGYPWLGDAIQTSVIAAVIAGIIALALITGARLRPLIAGVALASVLGTMWLSAIAVANSPTSNGVSNSGSGLSNVQVLASVPAYRPHMSDDDLYLIWVDHLRAGEPYYAMEVRSFAAANAARPDAPLKIRSPFSYRLPTLYVLLAKLPPNGISFVMAMMLACSIGVISAYVLARRFVRESVALAGAVIVAAFFSGYGGIILLDTESWAGPFVLASVAAFVVWRTRDDAPSWLAVLAVVFAVIAAAFRELAAALLMLGLAATLIDPELRQTKAWIAWAVGTAVVGVAVVAHWVAASQAYAAIVSRPISGSWFTPNGSGLLGALYLAAALMWLAAPACALLFALGAAGGVSASKDLATRIVLGGVAAGGLAILILVHPPGETNYGAAPGYWGDIVVPTTLAAVPLAFAWLASVRNGEPALDRRDDGALSSRQVA